MNVTRASQRGEPMNPLTILFIFGTVAWAIVGLLLILHIGFTVYLMVLCMGIIGIIITPFMELGR